MNTNVTGHVIHRKDTVAAQTMKEGSEDTVTKHPPEIYTDKQRNQWKLLAKIGDDAHFKRLRLSHGLKLHGYSKTTFQLYCPSRHKKCGRCPYRGLYLIGPRLLYHRYAHNHTRNKKNWKKVGKGPKTVKKKHKSRVDQQKPRSAEVSSFFKDQRSACQKRKTFSPVPGKSRSYL